MLSPQQIIAFSKTKIITKYSLMEYYQHEILDSFFKQKGSENYNFIGKTAIRIVYGGQRFSEDLDFDAKTIDNFDNLLETVLKDMENKDFSLEFRTSQQNIYHCYIKFPHILYDLGLTPHQDEKLLIKIDVSLEDSHANNSFLLNNYNVFRRISVASPNTLLSQKLLTILQRKRPKGRDLYDVIFLWGLAEPDQDYLLKKSGKTLPQILSEISDYASKLNLKTMQKEVLPLLLNTSDAEKVTLFQDYIKQKIKKQ